MKLEVTKHVEFNTSRMAEASPVSDTFGGDCGACRVPCGSIWNSVDAGAGVS